MDAPTTLWVITWLGYLYCVECARTIEVTGRVVKEGDCSFGSDNCDRCGKPVGESACGEITPA